MDNLQIQTSYQIVPNDNFKNFMLSCEIKYNLGKVNKHRSRLNILSLVNQHLCF